MKLQRTIIALIVLSSFQVKVRGDKSDTCGTRLSTAPIVHRHEARMEDWPWHAIIFRTYERRSLPVCAGSLLNKYTILTAAHCIYEEGQMLPAERILIRLWKIFDYDVDKTYVHFDFDPHTYKNDIAIIQLAFRATIENVVPICLWDDADYNELSEIVGKYGTLTSFLLYQAVIPVVDEMTCRQRDPNYFKEYAVESFFCAGFQNESNVLSDYEGGAIAFEMNGVYHIRGIVSVTQAISTHHPLRKSLVYVVLTDVTKYLDWIADIVPSLPSPPKDLVPEQGSCLIPHDIPSKVKVFYEGGANRELAKGSYVSQYSNIIYKCDAKYVLDQNTTNFCLDGKWTVKHPDCLKYCSPVPLSGVTIQASCEIFGESVSCQHPQRPNSTAHITCAVGYRRPDQPVTDVLHCDDDGEWDYHAFRCEPICGVEAPEVVPYIVGGAKVNITKVPWHVAIFTDISNKGTFTQICGGTIINAKMVISAAHCFWDVSENQLYEPSNFKVGAGKYYRDFIAIEPTKPQIVDVAQITTKQEYNDYAGYYAVDIALLILVDHFKFNSYIKPICLETNLNFNEKYVQPGLVGKVAGWGLEKSGGESSPELKYVELPAIEYNECKQKLSAELELFITGDKFCAGYTTGQSVCRGDSGGGLVFPKTVGSSTVYFLRGIVSTGGNKGGSCDNDQYTLFTNVQYHIEMVQFYESQNRPK